MKSSTRLALAFAALAVAAVARADFYTYTSSTVGGPTFNRPVEDGSALSGVGTDVSYHTLSFSVDADGEYFFTSLAIEPVMWDNFLLLYSSFNPSDGLSGYVAGNDDNLGLGSSGFAANLTAGSYTLVTTSFDNGVEGTFVNQILGPGKVTPVPEPASMAVLGLGAAALMRRRRARLG